MDSEAVARRLQEYVDSVDAMKHRRPEAPSGDQLVQSSAAIWPLVQALLPDAHWVLGKPGYTYTFDAIQQQALRALGLVRSQEEIEQMLGPRGPQLSAESLHPWIWQAAAALWDTGFLREAIQAAATSLDLHLQQKSGRKDLAGTELVRAVLGEKDPQPGRPRLRLPGDRTSKTWISQRDGLLQYAVGCLLLLRNPATHTVEQPAEQEGLEQLAALSLLARQLDRCAVEAVDGGEPASL
jgi:hypothetical protein